MFAKIMIDIAHSNVDKQFTYSIPAGLPVETGMHVLVPFGQGNSQKEGFVVEITDQFEGDFAIKDILRILEPYPVLLPDQLRLAQWMRQSYNCLMVEALRLMIPTQLRGGRVHEKIERTVTLPPETDYGALVASMRKKDGGFRSPKQAEVLDLLHRSGAEMSVSDINAFIPGASAAISALIKRGVLLEGGHVSFRRPSSGLALQDRCVTPTQYQLNAIDAVVGSLRAGPKTFLLHGVTGSGKTEVYMRCIEACLEKDLRSIMLVPEISLTPQTVGLFRGRFHEDVAVLHSRLSEGERFDEWRRIRLGKARVAVGARSAVFAPMEKLGLIIVDEEHEPSYQSEMTPRYQAVEVAQKRISLQNATLLLGSATPSLLTYYRSVHGRYTLLQLPERVQNRPLPKVEIVDMRQELLSGNNGIFSGELYDRLKECFRQGHQAMLFINRRGYSTFVSCRACGTVIQCPNCDISMTYHKQAGNMQCHFCGAVQPLPKSCPSCGKQFIKYFGIGTEQVEEEARRLFPEVSMLRMDTDTMTGKNAMQELLERFSSRQAQLLIGTQMIAKGHDFPNVTLVGVVAADATLCIPDYRSTERTFQLLTQVAGRAGRDESPGLVVIQTYSPGHPAIHFARNHDYDGFYHYEIMERQKALFPPFSIFVRLLLSGTDEALLSQTGREYGRKVEAGLMELLGEDAKRDLLMLLCSPAPVKKRKNVYRYQVLLKLLRTKNTSAVIRFIYDFADAHRNETFAAIEVNPQDML